LITPEACVVDEPVTYASVPAWDGLFGILPGRAPIVAKLGLGELRLDFPDREGPGGERSYLVEDGFVQMVGEKLTILAARAVPAEEITETDARAELAEAEARRPSPDATDPQTEADRLRRDRDRARLKVRMARANRAKRGAI
jgi:F-type H+-transporting ATPase subunit epsilon